MTVTHPRDDLVRATVVAALDDRTARGLDRRDSVTWLGKLVRANGVRFPYESHRQLVRPWDRMT